MSPKLMPRITQRMKNAYKTLSFVRFLIIGVGNTIFAFFSTKLALLLFEEIIGLFWVGFLITFLNVFVSFTTQKYFVFQSSGKFFIELIKSAVVFFIIAVLNGNLMWLLMGKLGWSFNVTFTFCLLISTLASYVFGKKFTFRVQKYDK